MSKRFAAVLVVVALVVASLLMGLFLWTHEREEVDVQPPPEPEARANPHLALEMFLDELDIDVHTASRPDAVDDADVAFVSSRVLIYEAWQEHLDGGWLHDGGHLVVAVEPGMEEAPDEIAELLDLDQFDIEEPQVADARVIEYSYDESAGADDFAELIEMIEEELHQHEQVMGPRRPDLAGVRQDDDRLMMLSAAREKGRVTVIPDERMLTNDGLAGGEMGQMLADVLGMSEEWPQQAEVVLGQHRRGWLDDVWSRGWPFFAALLLLLVAGLTRAKRFGPPIPEPDRRRRRRGEHIQATGQFLWDQNAQHVLVEAARGALIDELKRRRPSLKAMDDDRRMEAMAAQLDTRVATLKRLLQCPVPRKAAQTRDLIAELEEMRRRL